MTKIYPHFYPPWGIAFARVFGYTDSVEDMLITLHKRVCPLDVVTCM
jgi:hypothetical protein